jgi:uncharacterized protein (DUF2267 family)
MDYESFISTVQAVDPLPRPDAERVACQTLHVLDRRLSAGEAEDIARLLPEQLRSCITPERDREKFHLDGFLRRVAEETGLDRTAAEKAARAVLGALRRAVGRKEFSDLRSELPEDFQPFLDQAIAEAPPSEDDDSPFAGRLSFDEFLNRVAEEAGLDPGGARDRVRRATEAVLEALGIRITAGQADDLEPFLPYELRPALTRGLVEGGSGAVPLSLEAFIERVAAREGVSSDDATLHARAVFSVLREAVGDKEFEDTIAQLPDQYRMLLKQEANTQPREGGP